MSLKEFIEKRVKLFFILSLMILIAQAIIGTIAISIS